MTTHTDKTADGRKNDQKNNDESEKDPLMEATRLLKEILISKRGELTPEAQAQIALRSDEERGATLEQLVKELAPREVSPEMWREWLLGGQSPFGSRRLKKPVKLQHGAGKAIARGPKSLKPHRERVEKARAELAHAEEKLAYHEALDKSLMEVSVYDHLVKLLGPIFAMGPAWTIMRALSGHASDKLADDMTFLYDGKAKQLEIRKFRAEYAEETAKMLIGLDYFSGVEEFEDGLREAIKGVVEEFESRKDSVIADGRRRRSVERIMTSVNPEALDDAGDVLGGL